MASGDENMMLRINMGQEDFSRIIRGVQYRGSTET